MQTTQYHFYLEDFVFCPYWGSSSVKDGSYTLTLYCDLSLYFISVWKLMNLFVNLSWKQLPQIVGQNTLMSFRNGRIKLSPWGNYFHFNVRAGLQDNTCIWMCMYKKHERVGSLASECTHHLSLGCKLCLCLCAVAAAPPCGAFEDI